MVTRTNGKSNIRINIRKLLMTNVLNIHSIPMQTVAEIWSQADAAIM
jgi:hypothetical protein